LKVLPATAFEEDASGVYFYGGSGATHAKFWTHFTAPPSDLSTNELQTYVPTPRATPFSSGTTTTTSRPRPTGFGMVPVAVAVGTGVILGAKLSRSGSWNRTNYGSSSS
jgi:hypothetical protein